MKSPLLKLILLLGLLFLLACNSERKESAADTLASDSIVVDSLATDSAVLDSGFLAVEVDSNLKICTPKTDIGIEDFGLAEYVMIDPYEKVQKGGVIRDKRWPFSLDAPIVLKVYFMDGEATVQERVKKIAKEWEGVAKFKFNFVKTLSGADIKISFNKVGSWSYIGTDCKRNTPSMNLGWLSPSLPDIEYRRVVLHEFGHALGFGHEHQSPKSNPIKWKRSKVLAYFIGVQKWNTQMVEDNIFKTFATDLWIGTEYDPQSIMIYGIEKDLTENNFEIKWNNAISAKDIETVQKAYNSIWP